MHHDLAKSGIGFAEFMGESVTEESSWAGMTVWYSTPTDENR
jgi:hypothetical protein